MENLLIVIGTVLITLFIVDYISTKKELRITRRILTEYDKRFEEWLNTTK